ncbi:MAG: hypothetical protein ACPHRO_09200, partial [Nannocystaceae bacterium]
MTVRRVLGLIGVCWMLMTIQNVGWVLAVAGHGELSDVVIRKIFTVHAISLGGIGTLSLLFSPRLRDFPRAEQPPVIRGWLLAMVGFPMLPFTLVLPWALGRSETSQRPDPSAFRRATGLLTAAYGMVSTLAATATLAIVHLDTSIAPSSMLLLAGACVATTAPWSAILATRSQAIFAPYRGRIAVDDEHAAPPSLTQRFGLPTAAILIGMVCTPTLGGAAYVHEARRASATRDAHVDIARVTAIAESSDPTVLGEFLATHPNVAVRTRGQRYGKISLFDRIPQDTDGLITWGTGEDMAVVAV